MKTKRKVVKGSKGRRTSIICKKKSPISKKSQRTLRSATRANKLATYESLLKCCPKTKCTNSSLKSLDSIKSEEEYEDTKLNNDSSFTSISRLKIEEIDKDVSKEEIEALNNVNSLPSTSKINTETDVPNNQIIEDSLGNNEDETDDPDFIEGSPQPKKKKMGIMSRIWAGEIPKPNKNKKLKKKSPLSQFKESNLVDQLSESVIIVDDLECKSKIKTTSKEPIKMIESGYVVSPNNPKIRELFLKKESPEANKSSVSNRTLKNSDDIVIIDHNESSLMEMEEYHKNFNSTEDSTPVNLNHTDSVIVIDDEPSFQRKSVTPKPTEDCFVVWSSLPESCTVNQPIAQTSESSTNHLLHRFPKYNADLLKEDKILIDSSPDFGNLRFLNNENNKPILNKKYNSPKKVTTVTKKPLLVSKVKKLKDIKSTSKTVPKNNTPKATKVSGTTKTTPKLPKKKIKSSDGLIFLSESKETQTTEKKATTKKGKLREIVIDGNNVAMAYTHNKVFSEKGIKMLIDYFTKRGHVVKVFIPQYRRSRMFPLLEKWHTEGIVVFTPSRKLGNKNFTPYDDRYILTYATECDGIVVSQDQFRDLYAEKPEFRDTIENRLLVPTFVGDYVMFPEDPLGRNGPTLTNFLKH